MTAAAGEWRPADFADVESAELPFLLALLARPDDAVARAAYADWLEGRGERGAAAAQRAAWRLVPDAGDTPHVGDALGDPPVRLTAGVAGPHDYWYALTACLVTHPASPGPGWFLTRAAVRQYGLRPGADSEAAFAWPRPGRLFPVEPGRDGGPVPLGWGDRPADELAYLRPLFVRPWDGGLRAAYADWLAAEGRGVAADVHRATWATVRAGRAGGWESALVAHHAGDYSPPLDRAASTARPQHGAIYGLWCEGPAGRGAVVPVAELRHQENRRGSAPIFVPAVVATTKWDVPWVSEQAAEQPAGGGEWA